MHGDLPPLEGRSGGPPHLAAADDEHRIRIGVVYHEYFVQRGNLLGCADHDRHAERRELEIRPRRQEPPTLPHADDRGPGKLAQPCVADGPALERRVVHRELGEQQVMELADHVGVRRPRAHPVCEVLAELVDERQHVRGAAELQHVDRVFHFGQRDDGHRFGQLAYGEDNVGVDRVRCVGQDQASPCRSSGSVSLDGVDVAHEDRHAGILHVHRKVGVGLDHIDRHVRQLKAADEPGRNGIVGANQHVTHEIFRHRLERADAAAAPLLEPRRVHNSDEEEREDDEEQHHAGQQHEGGERAAQVALERDITEAEGAHHGERPIDSREPRVVLTFPRHDRVEKPAEEQHDRDEEDHVFHERRELPAQFGFPREQRGQKRADGFHAGIVTPQRPRSGFAPRSAPRTAPCGRRPPRSRMRS